jgi:flagellum-specific ATP synthase
MATPTVDRITQKLQNLPRVRPFGQVVGIAGLVVSVEGLQGMAVGSRCQITTAVGDSRIAEVVGYEKGLTQLMPFGPLEGVAPGAKVVPSEDHGTVMVNNSFIGRVINGLGEPVDGKGPMAEFGGEQRYLRASPPLASQRNAVGPRLDVGVRTLNTFLPICEGQRLGIFSGSGVGKSVLMSMIAKYSGSEVNVIGLIGERGREVREFIEQQLGPEGMAKSVVVVATSDEPPLMRRQAAYMTMAIAEYFRDCGFKVMLMMDSVTRFALAQREIGLASGEPPTTRGFTPSVFAELPKLLERAGPGMDKGFISAFFTVLVEGGDMEEPVADAVRGIVDGHVILTRELAERGHFPAVDVLKSISRMVPQCLSKDERTMITRARQLLATYNDMAELIRLGAYTKGTDPLVDEAIFYHDALTKFLQQQPGEYDAVAQSFQKLQQLLNQKAGR